MLQDSYQALPGSVYLGQVSEKKLSPILLMDHITFLPLMTNLILKLKWPTARSIIYLVCLQDSLHCKKP